MAINFDTNPRESIRVSPKAGEQTAAAPDKMDAWGGDGFGFDDFIDIINPLQHIPVISHIYRAITGDEAAPAAKMLGGALLGGPIGLVASAIDAVVEQESGADIGTHVANAFSPQDAKTQVAQTDAPKETEAVGDAAEDKIADLDENEDGVYSVAAAAEPTIGKPVKLMEQAAQEDKKAFGIPLANVSRAHQGKAMNEDQAVDVLSMFDPQITQAADRYRKAQALNQANDIRSKLKI